VIRAIVFDFDGVILELAYDEVIGAKWIAGVLEFFAGACRAACVFCGFGNAAGGVARDR